jgi:hypothetical protein
MRAPRAEPVATLSAREAAVLRDLRDLQATDTKPRDLGMRWFWVEGEEDGAEMAGEKEDVAAAAIDDSSRVK